MKNCCRTIHRDYLAAPVDCNVIDSRDAGLLTVSEGLGVRIYCSALFGRILRFPNVVRTEDMIYNLKKGHIWVAALVCTLQACLRALFNFGFYRNTREERAAFLGVKPSLFLLDGANRSIP